MCVEFVRLHVRSSSSQRVERVPELYLCADTRSNTNTTHVCVLVASPPAMLCGAVSFGVAVEEYGRVGTRPGSSNY